MDEFNKLGTEGGENNAGDSVKEAIAEETADTAQEEQAAQSVNEALTENEPAAADTAAEEKNEAAADLPVSEEEKAEEPVAEAPAEAVVEEARVETAAEASSGGNGEREPAEGLPPEEGFIEAEMAEEAEFAGIVDEDEAEELLAAALVNAGETSLDLASDNGAAQAAGPAKKDNTKKIALIIISAVVVLALITVAVLMLRKKDPRSRLLDAIAATSVEFAAQTNKISGDLGVSSFDKVKVPDYLNYYMNFTITDDLEDLPLRGTGIDMNMNVDMKNQNGNMDMMLKYAGMELYNMSAYFSKDFLAFAFPKMIDGIYGLHPDRIGKELNSPPLDEYFGGVLEDDYKLEFKDSQKTEDNLENELSALEIDSEKLIKALDNLKSNIVIEEGDKAVEVKVNGEKNICDEYIVTVSKENFKDFIKDFYEAFKDSILFEQLLEQEYMTKEEFEEYYFNDFIDEVETSLTAKCYVNQKYFVKADIELSVYDTYFEEASSVFFTIEIGGKNSMAEAVKMTAAIEEYEISFTLSGNYVDTKSKTYAPTLAFDVYDSYYEESMAMKLGVSYNSVSKTDNFSMAIEMNVEQMAFDVLFDGTMTVDPSKYMVDLDLYDGRVRINFVDVISFSLHYGIQESDEVYMPAVGEVTMFSDMTEEEFEDFITEITNQLMFKIMQWSV